MAPDNNNKKNKKQKLKEVPKTKTALGSVYDHEWSHPATRSVTCRLCLEQHREKTAAIGDAKKNKNQTEEELGRRRR